MGVINIEFGGTKGVCCFSPMRLRMRGDVSMMMRATEKLRCKAMMINPGRVSRDRLISPLGPVVEVTASRSERMCLRGGRGTGRAFRLYRRGVGRRSLGVFLVSYRCAFSEGGLVFCFATRNEVSFERLMGSLTSVFGAEVRLERVNIESRTGAVNKLKPYKEGLYYSS